MSLAILAWCSVLLALGGTFRNFGYDLNGMGETRALYPYVAEGWGFWYWLAQLRLNFNLYFFILTLLLSAGILLLAFPGRGPASRPVSLTILLYLAFWFLFAQTRYGMAVVLVALAIGANSFLLLILAGICALLVHRAIAGAVVLLALWLVLRKARHGLIIAAAISALLALVLYQQADTILVLTAFDNYAGLNNQPNANTPLKYYFDIAVLCAWKYFDKNAANSLLILALLFLPTAYYNVFAGRAHEVYAVVFLAGLLTVSMPRALKYILLGEYIADVAMLAFTSGAFF
jgi:hypothetical protein